MTETWTLAAIFAVCFVAAIASTLALGWLERRTARADTRTRHPAGRARCGHLVYSNNPAHLEAVVDWHNATCPKRKD